MTPSQVPQGSTHWWGSIGGQSLENRRKQTGPSLVRGCREENVDGIDTQWWLQANQVPS